MVSSNSITACHIRMAQPTSAAPKTTGHYGERTLAVLTDGRRFVLGMVDSLLWIRPTQTPCMLKIQTSQFRSLPMEALLLAVPISGLRTWASSFRLSLWIRAIHVVSGPAGFTCGELR